MLEVTISTEPTIVSLPQSEDIENLDVNLQQIAMKAVYSLVLTSAWRQSCKSNSAYSTAGENQIFR